MSYKVKLDDGSEIGPLDMDTLRTWYREGLIGPATPAQRMGQSRWSTLDKVVDIKRWGSTSASRKRAKTEDDDEEEAQGPGETPRWRTLLASVVLFLLALAAGGAALVPDRLPPDLDGAPWTEVALGLVVSGLLLVRGWELGRKVARLLLFLASFGLLAAGGALVARQAGQQTWLVLGAAWLVCFGLVAFLARGSLRWFQAALWLIVVAGGLAGLVRFGWVPETVLGVQAREWGDPSARWASDVSGWALDPPKGWVRLREGNPVAPGADTAATFAAPRLGAIAVLWETPARGDSPLDRDLDALVEHRRQAVPGLELVDRTDDRLGGLPARRGSGRWVRDDAGREVAYAERDVVWSDGWLRYSLAVWAPEGGAAQRGMALEPHPGPEGTLDDRLQKASTALAAEQPLLSEAAARAALVRGRTLQMSADTALLGVLSAAAAGRGALSAGDASRLRGIEAQLDVATARRDRSALRAVLEGRGDAGSLAVLKRAAAELNPEERLYLRELWGQASRAQP